MPPAEVVRNPLNTSRRHRGRNWPAGAGAQIFLRYFGTSGSRTLGQMTNPRCPWPPALEPRGRRFLNTLAAYSGARPHWPSPSDGDRRCLGIVAWTIGESISSTSTRAAGETARQSTDSVRRRVRRALLRYSRSRRWRKIFETRWSGGLLRDASTPLPSSHFFSLSHRIRGPVVRHRP
jgi:hypothetical protein